MNSKRYVFGYGSILNPASMAKDVDPKRFVKWITIQKHERIFNVQVEGALALNLRPHPFKSVEGILIEADDVVFEALDKREKGYSPLDITSFYNNSENHLIYAYIAPQDSFPSMHILQKYVDECKFAIPPSLQDSWLSDSVIENPIV